MRKGVILEINDLYLTLLTPEGEFMRARKLQQVYVVGEEIHFFPEKEVARRNKLSLSIFNSFKIKSIAIAAVVMLVFAAFIPTYQSGQVYAYVSIDVNPSVELAVSDKLEVIRIKGYNPEGKEIVENLVGWKKKDAAVVTEMIIDKIEEEGYFENKRDIVIATVHKGKVKEAADRKLKQKIADIKQTTQAEDLELKVLRGTSEDREKAQKQGVSTGTYKEKQIEKDKPVKKDKPDKKDKPVKKDKPDKKPLKPEEKPEDAKKNMIVPVKPNPVQKEPPGQVKKENPVKPKVEPPKPAKPVPGKSNGRPSDQDQNKKINHNTGNGNSGHTGNINKPPKNEPKVKHNQKESNKQGKGQSGGEKGNKDKK